MYLRFICCKLFRHLDLLPSWKRRHACGLFNLFLCVADIEHNWSTKNVRLHISDSYQTYTRLSIGFPCLFISTVTVEQQQVHQTFKQSNEENWLKKAAREAGMSMSSPHSKSLAKQFAVERVSLRVIFSSLNMWMFTPNMYLFRVFRSSNKTVCEADLVLDEDDDTREVGKSKAGEIKFAWHEGLLFDRIR